MGKLYRDLVRAHSKAKGSSRALLNILADYADDDGLAWPGRAQLASDTGMSERNVVRCIQTLCADGRLSIEENAKGGRGRVPVYKILIPERQKGDNLSPFTDGKRVTNARIKGDKSVIKGDKSVANYSHARSEPQEPHKEPGETPARKVVHYKSPHLDPRHFVNGYIPPGAGVNAVEVYYERFSINQDAARLNAIKEDDLSRLCPDLDKLRSVIVAYSRTTFQPGNVQLILDWYSGGIPEKHKPPGQSSNTNGAMSEAKRNALITRAKTAQANIRTAEYTGTAVNPQWHKDIDAARGLT